MSVREVVSGDSDKIATGRSTRTGIFADPVVTTMIYVALGLVVLFLASVVGVLATGIATPSGPRSVAERQLLLASSTARGAAGDAGAPYITALVATGDFSAARIALLQARSGEGTATMPALDLAEARLKYATADYADAITFADSAMRGFIQKYEQRIASGGAQATAAKNVGYGEDYYNAALVKAYCLSELGKFDAAIEAFDIYIEHNPTAADILVDRANARLEAGDQSGAEADFREVLKYIPDSTEALQGLEKIGAAK